MEPLLRERFLLLNPPGRRRYLRDYYCSSVAKADYYWHPGDLLFQSGILDSRYDVHLIDAIAEEMSRAECFNRINKINPQYIYFLTSAASWKNDFEFAAQLKAKATFASGEIFLSEPKKWLEQYDFLDAALLDFTTRDILSYLDGRFDSIERMVFRKNGVIEQVNKKSGNTFEIPVPLHEKFIGRYRMPFAGHRLFASLLTDHGCPHRCAFCNSWVSGYKKRTAQNIEDELEHIGHLGIRQLFLKDMSFGADKKHAEMVLGLLLKRRLDWHCYARPDDMDESLLLQMKRSGCYLIQYGIEHVNSKLLSDQNKRMEPEKVKKAIDTTRKLGMRAGAHFILGLPGENSETLCEVERFVSTLKVDYISVNTAAPRYGTPLRERLIERGETMPDHHDVSTADWYSNPEVPYTLIKETKKKVLRKFYLRPGYLFEQLARCRSFYEFFGIVSNGIALFKTMIRPGQRSSLKELS